MIAKVGDLHYYALPSPNVVHGQMGNPQKVAVLLSALIASTRDAEHCVHQPSGGEIPSVFKFILDNMPNTAILKVSYPSPHSGGW